ncbi:MAG: zf-HC2 domain-containing protein, partial [Myxococcota bacterium]
MDCTDIKALISGLLDGELGESTRHLAERHLAECKSCRARLDEVERLDRRVAAEAEGHVEARGLPATFEGEVLSQTVYAEGPRRGRWTNWLGWLAAAASLGLAITIGMLNGRDAGEAAGPEKALAYLTGGELKSSVFDGDLTEEILLPGPPEPP